MTVSMLRRTWLPVLAAVAAVVVALTLVGHGGSRPAAAAVDPAAQPDTVAVVGVGTADGAPDTLSVDFTVRAVREDVQSALDAQAHDARSLFRALQDAGVARSRLQTTDLSLDRHYDNHGNPIGYEASETVRARITPLTNAGRTISAGARSAGNSVSVGSMSFDIGKDSALLTQARANAFADAKTRAQQYADLAGRSLGRVLKVSEHVSAPPPAQFYGDALYARSAAAGSAVPLRHGQQTLTVHVDVVWALA